ncbi:uncharacterized protein [Nicotiana sylvestris]|uniref:uncharacterized protein n=1 Tax=Nicotiana sylvestris TaxID=4096 RepID=UPI00388CC81D
MRFWEGMDDIVRSIPPSERLFVGGDFNGHIGSSAVVYTEVHGGYSVGERNRGGTSLLDFSKAFNLVIANSSFPKRDEHLVTYKSSVAKTQIDYLLLRRCGRLCEDCKVIPGETLAMQHRLLVMDIGIRIRRKKRKAEREVLGISSGCTVGHKGDWWWNAIVQDKVEAKKAAYLRFVGSSGEEERRENSKRYKVARREAKMAVMEAKMIAFACLYEELGNKGGEKKLFRQAKIKRRWQTYFHKLLNEERDQDIVLSELRNANSPHELSYYGDIEVDEVMEAMRKMRRGRATGDKKKDLHMVFIDLEKAYDRVPREVLWRFLDVKGVPVDYIRVIKDMYDGAKTRIRTVGGDSDHFPVVTGLHQGSAFSPFLFALVIDAITHHIQGELTCTTYFYGADHAVYGPDKTIISF